MSFRSDVPQEPILAVIGDLLTSCVMLCYAVHSNAKMCYYTQWRAWLRTTEGDILIGRSIL